MAKCEHCNGTGKIEYYHDAGDHFSAGPAPNSGMREKPCPYCSKSEKPRKYGAALKLERIEAENAALKAELAELRAKYNDIAWQLEEALKKIGELDDKDTPELSGCAKRYLELREVAANLVGALETWIIVPPSVVSDYTSALRDLLDKHKP